MTKDGKEDVEVVVVVVVFRVSDNDDGSDWE